jgi:hypothetical protein
MSQQLIVALAACAVVIGMTSAPASGNAAALIDAATQAGATSPVGATTRVDATSSDLPGSRAAQLQDLEVVRTEYLPKEMAYSPAARTLAEAQLDQLERQAGSLSAAQFTVGLALLGGLTDNAHSGLRRFDRRALPASRLPLHLLWFPDALIVARATGAAASLAGARVMRIEGRSPEALFADSKALLGGSPAGRKHWLNDWIESAGILHALGVAGSADRLSMTLRLRDGSIVDRVIEMTPVSQMPPTAERARLWSPEPKPGEHGWAAAIPTLGLPLYLREADRPFRAVPLPVMNALYVQFRSNEDEEGFPIKTFLDSVNAKIAATHPDRLVVDLRFDEGGNLLTTLDFMRRLPSSVRGRTYLLVGPYTFSAGIISAAAIKQSGGDKVTVVGDTIGDRLHFWSEGKAIDLPNSHYSFRYTDGQFNLKDGCTGEPACMDDRYPINVNFVPLEPAIRAPLTAAAYFALRDPAMEAVAADIAHSGRHGRNP